MGSYAIRVENLGKQYTIGQYQGRYKSLRDSLTSTFAAPFKRLFSRNALGSEQTTIWALKDVSFEVQPGEVVGIIGRNGAGKSTLLKILARITEPTEGEVHLRGRVGSLLEVGTGFHSELTGRENIFLNGAILGMSRKEIQRKFDEIVDFAEIEKFIDTPAKHYSSGMYMRLAFAVAAHLEPEILLVDEVLAVGDAEFQNKCLGKMGEVANQGRTVIFVSHNMSAILNLCPKSIFLQFGRVIEFGDTKSVIHFYSSHKNVNEKKSINSYRTSWAKPFITDTRILDDTGIEKNIFPLGSNLIVEVKFSAPTDIFLYKPVLGIVINDIVKGAIVNVNMRMTGFTYPRTHYNNAIIRCKLTNLPLLQGQYNIDIWLGDEFVDIDAVFGYLNFSISEGNIYRKGMDPINKIGLIYLFPSWEII